MAILEDEERKPKVLADLPGLDMSGDSPGTSLSTLYEFFIRSVISIQGMIVR